MIPQEHKSVVSQWVAHEASTLGDEVVWQDDWRGVYRATRRIGDHVLVFEFTARPVGES